jgi:gluconate 2-dehydrogenase gamma chain
MLKASSTNHHPSDNEKKGALIKDYQGPLASGLNRRAFLRTSTAISLLAGITLTKPTFAIQQTALNSAVSLSELATDSDIFTPQQQQVIDAVQMQLFPDDGDGPSAQALNALAYLEWAMTDQQNIDDGDADFITKGIGWLNDLAKQTHGDLFNKLTYEQQDKVLKQVAKSQVGENWISLLLYYLTEALMLDPVYGGNPNMISWQWLEHQPGFPAPIIGKTYRDFL